MWRQGRRRVVDVAAANSVRRIHSVVSPSCCALQPVDVQHGVVFIILVRVPGTEVVLWLDRVTRELCGNPG